MRSISIVLICFFASTCAAGDSAADCTSNADDGDDKCTLLQGGVGLVSLHEKDKHEKHAEEKKLSDDSSNDEGKKVEQKKDKHEKHAEQKKLSDDNNNDDSKEIEHKKGWPGDILKHITAAIGGVAKLEKDFDGVKAAVATFAHEVHKSVSDLIENVKDQQEIAAVVTQVEATWKSIHESAMKLFEAVSKTSDAFTATIGEVAPDDFGKAVKEVLDKMTSKAKHFAEEFDTAANRLTQVNRTMVCGTVKHHLDTMHKKVDGFVKAATGLTSQEMNEDIKKALEMLPESIKKEVDKILAKADEAAEKLKSSTQSIMQEISMGISQAFKGHCSELQSPAGRVEVGLLSALVIGLLGLLI